MTTFSLRKAAKLIGFSGGLIKFAEWLRKEKYLMPDLEPYQRYIDLEYFVYKKKTIKAANKTVCSPQLTLKGLYNIRRKLK